MFWTVREAKPTMALRCHHLNEEFGRLSGGAVHVVDSHTSCDQRRTKGDGSGHSPALHHSPEPSSFSTLAEHAFLQLLC